MTLSTPPRWSIIVMVTLVSLSSSLCFTPRSVGPMPSLRKHVTSRSTVLMSAKPDEPKRATLGQNGAKQDGKQQGLSESLWKEAEQAVAKASESELVGLQRKPSRPSGSPADAKSQNVNVDATAVDIQVPTAKGEGSEQSMKGVALEPEVQAEKLASSSSALENAKNPTDDEKVNWEELGKMKIEYVLGPYQPKRKTAPEVATIGGDAVVAAEKKQDGRVATPSLLSMSMLASSPEAMLTSAMAAAAARAKQMAEAAVPKAAVKEVDTGLAKKKVELDGGAEAGAVGIARYPDAMRRILEKFDDAAGGEVVAALLSYLDHDSSARQKMDVVVAKYPAELNRLLEKLDDEAARLDAPSMAAMPAALLSYLEQRPEADAFGAAQYPEALHRLLEKLDDEVSAAAVAAKMPAALLSYLEQDASAKEQMAEVVARYPAALHRLLEQLDDEVAELDAPSMAAMPAALLKYLDGGAAADAVATAQYPDALHRLLEKLDDEVGDSVMEANTEKDEVFASVVAAKMPAALLSYLEQDASAKEQMAEVVARYPAALHRLLEQLDDEVAGLEEEETLATAMPTAQAVASLLSLSLLSPAPESMLTAAMAAAADKVREMKVKEVAAVPIEKEEVKQVKEEVVAEYGEEERTAVLNQLEHAFMRIEQALSRGDRMRTMVQSKAKPTSLLSLAMLSPSPESMLASAMDAAAARARKQEKEAAGGALDFAEQDEESKERLARMVDLAMAKIESTLSSGRKAARLEVEEAVASLLSLSLLSPSPESMLTAAMAAAADKVREMKVKEVVVAVQEDAKGAEEEVEYGEEERTAVLNQLEHAFMRIEQALARDDPFRSVVHQSEKTPTSLLSLAMLSTSPESMLASAMAAAARKQEEEAVLLRVAQEEDGEVRTEALKEKEEEKEKEEVAAGAVLEAEREAERERERAAERERASALERAAKAESAAAQAARERERIAELRAEQEERLLLLRAEQQHKMLQRWADAASAQRKQAKEGRREAREGEEEEEATRVLERVLVEEDAKRVRRMAFAQAEAAAQMAVQAAQAAQRVAAQTRLRSPTPPAAQDDDDEEEEEQQQQQQLSAVSLMRQEEEEEEQQQQRSGRAERVRAAAPAAQPVALRSSALRAEEAPPAAPLREEAMALASEGAAVALASEGAAAVRGSSGQGVGTLLPLLMGVAVVSGAVGAVSAGSEVQDVAPNLLLALSALAYVTVASNKRK